MSEKRWSGLTVVIGAALSALACAVESPTEGAGGAGSTDAGTGGRGDLGAGFEIEGGPSPGGSFGTGGVGVELEAPDQCAEIEPFVEGNGNCWERGDLVLECFAPGELRDGRLQVHLWTVHRSDGELTSYRTCGDGGTALCPSADELYWSDDTLGCGAVSLMPACHNPTVEEDGRCCYWLRRVGGTLC